MNVTGPITDAERNGWQLRNAVALVDLLKAAHEADLPTISWRVTVTDLIGTCERPDAADARAVFGAWARHLHAETAEVPVGGAVRLRATREGYGPHAVRVVVLADVVGEPQTESVHFRFAY